MQWNRWQRFVSNPKFNAFIIVLDPLCMSDDEVDNGEVDANTRIWYSITSL